MPDNIASETGDFRFRQNSQFSKAAACRVESDTDFAHIVAWGSQAGPADAPAKGAGHPAQEGQLLTMGRAVPCRGGTETSCPHWHRNALHTPPALPNIWWQQTKCLKHYRRAELKHFVSPKPLQKKGVCENTAWYWPVGSIFTFLVIPIISSFHSGKHIW